MISSKYYVFGQINISHQIKNELHALNCLYIYTTNNRVLTLNYYNKIAIIYISIDPCYILFYNKMIYVSLEWR